MNADDPMTPGDIELQQAIYRAQEDVGWLMEAYVSAGIMTQQEAYSVPDTGKPSMPVLPEQYGEGLHPDLDDDAYFAIDARSNTELSQAYSRRALLAHWAGKFDIESDAMRLGTAAHMLLLQPDEAKFNTDWPVNPKTGNGYGSDTKKVAEWMAEVERSGGYPISQDKLDEACRIRDAVLSHEMAGKLLRASGMSEVVGLWSTTRLDRKIWFKMKIDRYIPGWGMFDLKTTSKEVSPRVWPWRISSFGYHRQAAHYMRGAKTLGLDCPRFSQIVVGSSFPHEVMVVELDPSAIKHGQQDCDAGINNFMDVMHQRNTGFMSEGIEMVSLPLSVMARYADDEMEQGRHD